MTAAATIQQKFPPPPACPDWCDGKHGIEPDQWESKDEVAGEVTRCHAHTIGDVAGKAGVEIIAMTSAKLGGQPVTGETQIEVWVNPPDAELSSAEALALADLLHRAATEVVS